jgi:hypothetical protein
MPGSPRPLPPRRTQSTPSLPTTAATAPAARSATPPPPPPPMPDTNPASRPPPPSRRRGLPPGTEQAAPRSSSSSPTRSIRGQAAGESGRSRSRSPQAGAPPPPTRRITPTAAEVDTSGNPLIQLALQAAKGIFIHHAARTAADRGVLPEGVARGVEIGAKLYAAAQVGAFAVQVLLGPPPPPPPPPSQPPPRQRRPRNPPGFDSD